MKKILVSLSPQTEEWMKIISDFYGVKSQTEIFRIALKMHSERIKKGYQHNPEVPTAKGKFRHTKTTDLQKLAADNKEARTEVEQRVYDEEIDKILTNIKDIPKNKNMYRTNNNK